MSCDTCNQNSNSNLPYIFKPGQGSSDCERSTCSQVIDSMCIKYTGTSFNCISNESKTLENILKYIDGVICEGQGGIPWGTFNYACLEGITSAQTFAETISEYVCDLSSTVTSNYNEIIDILNNISSTTGTYIPAISGCSFTGIVNTDNLNTVLTKLNNSFCTLKTITDVSTVDFQGCFTVSPQPTTIAEALTVILDQICQVKASIPATVTLPTFNNIGSCLPSPGATDTLVATINKIKTVLCSKPDFDVNSLSPYYCVAAGTDLISTIENIRSKITQLTLSTIQEVGPGLTLTALASPEACEGMKLEIDPDAFPDEMVKANAGDTTPGYLIDKLNEGDNITIDDTTLPGAVTITADNNKVATSSLDPTADYLISKLLVESTPELLLTLSEDSFTNPSSYKAKITPAFDYYALAEKILTVISTSTTLRELFCSISCDSLPTCAPPSNVSATYINPDFLIGYSVPPLSTGLNVYYRKRGDTVWLTTDVDPVNPQVTFGGPSVYIRNVDPVTVYEIKVSSICPDTSEADSNIIEAMSVTALSPTVEPGTTSINFDFGTLPYITKITLTIKDLLNVVIGTYVNLGPSFVINTTGLTSGTSYNVEYKYTFLLNGSPVDSAVYTLSTVSTL